MRPLLRWALAGALTVVSVPAGADTYPRQTAVDAIHYRFHIELADLGGELPRIRGEALATFRLSAPVAHVELDLINAEGERGMTVRRVTLDGLPVAFTHEGHRLRLAVPDEATAGDELTYAIAYEGAPADGLRLFTNLHGERVVFSEGWPNRARHWLPMIDHPYDKATGELIVTAPAEWQVVSNGLLVEEVDLDGGRRRTHWRQSVPLASWLYAVGAGRFDVHHAGHVEGVPLQTWAFPQDRDAARALFEETSRGAMAFFASRIGPYPYEKLANVQASGFGGGMENATVIFYGEKGVASGRGPVVHEIAHQWFGNSVTERDWDDVWLSEGFATYFALLYQEHAEGRDAFVEGLKRSRASILALAQKLPDTPVVHRNLDDMSQVLNGFVYQKGGWVLHMLRAELGTETFWRAIREYYRRFRDANASTDDLRQVFERTSGRDLRWFFEQWLHRGGNPQLEVGWRYDAGRRVVEVTVRQTQQGEPYTLNVDLAIVTPSGRQLQSVRLDAHDTTVSVESAEPPTEITVDPETRLLAEWRVEEAR